MAVSVIAGLMDKFQEATRRNDVKAIVLTGQFRSSYAFNFALFFCSQFCCIYVFAFSKHVYLFSCQFPGRYCDLIFF